MVQALRDTSSPTPTTSVPPTPWLPHGVSTSRVTLDTEMEWFLKLVELTDGERQVRADAVALLERAAKAEWPECALDVYGSLAAGLATASSVVDVILSGCGRQLCPPAARAVSDAVGKVKAFTACGSANGAFAQLETATGIVMNVTFCVAAAIPAGRSVGITKAWLADMPHVRGTHAVVRQVLTQTGCLNAGGTGLSSYALLVMIVHAARVAGPAMASPGKLLLFVAEYYGFNFDFARHSVVADSQLPAPKGAHSTAQLSVCDPCNPTNNLAAGCLKLFAIQSQLRHCLTTLRRWEGDGQRPGYRGRTPLSGLLSYQKLWERASARQPPSPRDAAATPTGSDGLTDDEGSPAATQANTSPLLCSGDSDDCGDVLAADDCPPLLDDDMASLNLCGF